MELRFTYYLVAVIFPVMSLLASFSGQVGSCSSHYLAAADPRLGWKNRANRPREGRESVVARPLPERIFKFDFNTNQNPQSPRRVIDTVQLGKEKSFPKFAARPAGRQSLVDVSGISSSTPEEISRPLPGPGRPAILAEKSLVPPTLLRYLTLGAVTNHMPQQGVAVSTKESGSLRIQDFLAHLAENRLLTALMELLVRDICRLADAVTPEALLAPAARKKGSKLRQICRDEKLINSPHAAGPQVSDADTAMPNAGYSSFNFVLEEAWTEADVILDGFLLDFVPQS